MYNSHIFFGKSSIYSIVKLKESNIYLVKIIFTHNLLFEIDLTKCPSLECWNRKGLSMSAFRKLSLETLIFVRAWYLILQSYYLSTKHEIKTRVRPLLTTSRLHRKTVVFHSDHIQHSTECSTRTSYNWLYITKLGTNL